MKRFRLGAVLVGCALALFASTAWAVDLTTFGDSTEQARIARYTVNMGVDYGDTCGYLSDGSVYRGAYDYISHRGGGWADPWWIMNNGDVNNAADTYSATDAEDFYGYRFKQAASVTQINYANRIYADGGTFAAAPRVEVLSAPMEQGGTWSTVAATWNTPYDSSYTNPSSIRQYTLTIDAPTGMVWGVRLIGAPSGTADGNGFVGLGELQVLGETSITKTINLGENLALGQTPLWSGTTHFGRSQILTDGHYEHYLGADDARNPNPGTEYWGYEDTWGMDGRDGVTYDEEYIGVMFDSAKSNVAAIGTAQKMFGDGGWITPETTVVEYTSDGGTTWTAVTGLDMGRWADMVNELNALPWDYVHSELMTFDTIGVAIDGIRMRGTPYGHGLGYGDATGFLGAVEFEAFAAVPEPGTLVMLLALALGGWFWRVGRR